MDNKRECKNIHGKPSYNQLYKDVNIHKCLLIRALICEVVTYLITVIRNNRTTTSVLLIYSEIKKDVLGQPKVL